MKLNFAAQNSFNGYWRRCAPHSVLHICRLPFSRVSLPRGTVLQYNTLPDTATFPDPVLNHI